VLPATAGLLGLPGSQPPAVPFGASRHAPAATNRIVWQYGHSGKSGSASGYLYDPDGVDLVPPDSLLVTHAAAMGEP
jgi:hypothetical protein